MTIRMTKDGNGNHSGKHWTRKTERYLIKCFLIHDCIMLSVMACRPILIHSIPMSIIFEHYKQLRKIVNERICSSIK